MTLRSTLGAALLAAVLAPGAVAHGGLGGKLPGGGTNLGYHSIVIQIAPADPAVHIQVVDLDDRLQARVDGTTILIIDGYENEPYLRFDPTGVYRNTHSPATYLNDARYADIKLPGQANPNAAPTWEKIALAGRPYEWHDHRIHWMNPTYPPPAVKDDKTAPHHIFDWTVPGSLDGQRFQIHGRLDYKPPASQKSRILLVAIPLALLSIGCVVLMIFTRARRTSPNPRS